MLLTSEAELHWEPINKDEKSLEEWLKDLYSPEAVTVPSSFGFSLYLESYDSNTGKWSAVARLAKAETRLPGPEVVVAECTISSQTASEGKEEAPTATFVLEAKSFYL